MHNSGRPTFLDIFLKFFEFFRDHVTYYYYFTTNKYYYHVLLLTKLRIVLFATDYAAFSLALDNSEVD